MRDGLRTKTSVSPEARWVTARSSSSSSAKIWREAAMTCSTSWIIVSISSLMIWCGVMMMRPVRRSTAPQLSLWSCTTFQCWYEWSMLRGSAGLREEVGGIEDPLEV